MTPFEYAFLSQAIALADTVSLLVNESENLPTQVCNDLPYAIDDLRRHLDDPHGIDINKVKSSLHEMLSYVSSTFETL